jgi:hypothetical protein
LKAAKPTRLYVLFVLALFMGCGAGELLGLKWDDIDWIEKTLDVGALCNASMGTASGHPEDPGSHAGRCR